MNYFRLVAINRPLYGVPWWNSAAGEHYDVKITCMCDASGWDVGFSQEWKDSRKSKLNARRDIPASSGFRFHILHYTGSGLRKYIVSTWPRGIAQGKLFLIDCVHRSIYKRKCQSEQIPEPCRSLHLRGFTNSQATAPHFYPSNHL